MKKILVMYADAAEHLEELEKVCAGRATFTCLPRRCEKDEFLAAIPGVNVIMGDPDPSWLIEAPEVEWFHTPWAGVRPYVEAAGIGNMIFTNSAGAYGPAVSDHLLALFLSLTRRIHQYARIQHEGNWARIGNEWYIEGKRALVLGAGDLGSHVAKRLKGFGMEVTGLCRRAREAQPPFDRLITESELDALLPEMDLVVGCLPSSPYTVGMLHADRLRSMKKNSILVNAGRGDVLDTEVLTALLAAGHFWGIGLDVTDPEPLPPSHPLWQDPNAIITPHSAGLAFGFSELTDRNLWDIALDNLERYLDGRKLKHVVDISVGY